MAVVIKFDLHPSLCQRNPQETTLGKKIIQNSIELIDEIGFESFNFKKLAQRINSTEASIYRYFENKHLLLLFLVSWYWEWVNYLIDFNTMNIKDPKEKLKIAIKNIINASIENQMISYVNEHILHRIVISEGSKAYHTKSIDSENKDGLFINYKCLAEKIMHFVKEIDPKFPYPRTLASNLLEMANNQIYFALHLPRLTDIKIKDENYESVNKMMQFFAFGLLSK
jgi:AcrR family transcriptional regulator